MTELLLLLVSNIIPLYALIALGFISGRWLDVNLHSIAIIAIYILAPVVNFGALARMEFTPEYMLLPVFAFCISSIIGIVAYNVARVTWKNNRANLIGMASVVGNTMYFGLPVVLALLGEQWAGVYALLNLGIFLNEVGLGYFFGARGNATILGALKKVAKLPVIYAILAGLAYNLSGAELPEAFLRYWNYAIGAWVFIGMMIIGVALGKLEKLELDWKLTLNLFIPKFVAWPLLGFACVLTDLYILHWYEYEVHAMFIIITCVPLAGNLVAYSATLNLHPEKAAAAVLLSTIFGLFSVPGAVLLLQYFSNS